MMKVKSDAENKKNNIKTMSISPDTSLQVNKFDMYIRLQLKLDFCCK